MFEIAEFERDDIDDAIGGLDALQDILVPFFKVQNFEGLGEEDAQMFVRHVTLAKHALILMGCFVEQYMQGGESE